MLWLTCRRLQVTGPFPHGAPPLCQEARAQLKGGARAEYSRTFMRLACAYLEGRNVGPVLPSSLADPTLFDDPPPTPPGAGADAASAPAAAAGGPDPTPEGPGSASGLAADGADSSTGEGAAEATSEQELAGLSARGALAAAHAGTRLPGSSTACVLQLNRAARTVSAANLVHPSLARFHFIR